MVGTRARKQEMEIRSQVSVSPVGGWTRVCAGRSDERATLALRQCLERRSRPKIGASDGLQMSVQLWRQNARRTFHAKFHFPNAGSTARPWTARKRF